jgi:hypothetical protein
MTEDPLAIFYDAGRKRRVSIVGRGDGTVCLWQREWCRPSDFQAEQWVDDPTNIICASMEIGRREAFGNFPWLLP